MLSPTQSDIMCSPFGHDMTSAPAEIFTENLVFSLFPYLQLARNPVSSRNRDRAEVLRDQKDMLVVSTEGIAS